jgi:hypothetical protein
MSDVVLTADYFCSRFAIPCIRPWDSIQVLAVKAVIFASEALMPMLGMFRFEGNSDPRSTVDP